MLLLAGNLLANKTGNMASSNSAQVPEHFFEHCGVVTEVRLLLLELFPGSDGARPVAVADPCARIMVHPIHNCTLMYKK